MTIHISKVTAMVAVAIFLPWLALAQQPTLIPYQTLWGAASNGICAGLSTKQNDQHSPKDDLICCMEIGNTTTNLLWAWFPRFEQRYEIKLRGPDGRQIRQLKPLLRALHTQWCGLKPLSTNQTSASLDWFVLKDTFDIRTNGQFTLIASVRVNVFTSFIAGQSKMQSQPTYFLLPPVTNTFNILPEYLPSIGQTNSPSK